MELNLFILLATVISLLLISSNDLSRITNLITKFKVDSYFFVKCFPKLFHKSRQHVIHKPFTCYPNILHGFIELVNPQKVKPKDFTVTVVSVQKKYGTDNLLPNAILLFLF